MSAPQRLSISLSKLVLAAIIVTIALLSVVASASAVVATERPMRLTLLHNNDGESKLASGSSMAGYGGAARFKTVTDRLRAAADARVTNSQTSGAAGKGTLMVSSGDNFLAGLALLKGFSSGPPWPDAIAINALNYDAITLGNHEFDFGQARLAEFISGVDSDVPFISANLGFESTIPALRSKVSSGRLKRSTIVGSGSERVGVIGLTTADIAGISSPGNVRIEADLAAVVNREAGRLHRDGVNKVIVSAHLQSILNDEALIPLVRGVDIWIAGGGDDLLASPDDTLIPGDSAVGSYPKSVVDKNGAPVLVVSTAGEYKYVGRLSVDFSARGTVRSVDQTRSGPMRVSGTLSDPDYAPEDAAVKADAVDPVTSFSASLAAEPVGSTEVALQRTTSGSPSNDPIRRRESGFGNLVADSYLWKARQLAAGNPQIDSPQVAIANGGGIRADIPVGAINKAQTFATLPFFNQISVVEDVECEELRQLLERGYSGLPSITGQFANIAGMRVEIDATQQVQVISAAPAAVTIVTPGERVRNLWLDNGTPTNTADDTQLIASGTAVPGCASVDLATVDFTARDGDRYPFTTQGLTPLNVGAIYNQALEDFIIAPAASGGLDGVVAAATYPVSPGGVRRITIAGD
ncbi:MAG: 5'-nucleotidase C-terminal domain-containing protein [Solirubrobacterales bacterium]